MNFENIEFIPYEEMRPIMRTGDSLAWSGDLNWNPLHLFGLVSKCIQIVAPGEGPAKVLKLNHISSIMRFERIDRVIQMEAIASGFIPTPVSEMIEKYHGRVYYLPMWKHLHDIDTEMGIMKWLWDMAWVKYDYKSILKQLTDRVSIDARRLFCSEADFMAKKEGGKVECLQSVTIAPRPCDIPMLPCYKNIFRIK